MKQSSSNGLKVVFLGGVGEIGKNMTAFEYGDDIIVVDSGLGFPDDSMPGIDLVVQDISWLVQNKARVRAFVITHGHEDHIGSLPYTLADIPAPVYGSRLTLALIDKKLREHPNIKVKAVSVKPRAVVQIGAFKVEFIHVNHSVAGCFALAISTPAGVVFHTGDFKIDLTPVDGQVIDLTRIGELGKKGIDLLLCESTNVERKGFSLSETTVGEKMGELFEKFKDRRLFVATFASNVHRVQQLIDLAVKFNRKVAFSGRSMLNVTDAAMKIGEMKIDTGRIIDIAHVGNFKNEEVLVVLTGSQGEPGSALARMSTGEFNKIHLGSGDTVILSSAPIPGNEKSVNTVVNNLIKRGTEVVYESLAEVHVSGHACEEEIKIMHALTKPKFFIPLHGEHKHLKKHSVLAQRLGMPARNIAIPELGEVWELTPNNLKKLGVVPSGIRLIDGKGSGTTDSNVLRDRMTMSDEGICIIGIGYNKQSGELTSGPDITTRGLLYLEEMEAMIPEIRDVIREALKKHNLNGGDPHEIRTTIRKDVQHFFFQKKKRRPMVVTMLQSN